MEYKLRGYTLINKRKDRRLAVDLNARVDGDAVMVKDISFGGMAIIAFDADLEIEDDVLVEIDIPTGGTLSLNATIVRVGADDEFGLQFKGMSSKAFRQLEDLQTGHSRRKRHSLKASSAGV